jgi:hypothetical protein
VQSTFALYKDPWHIAVQTSLLEKFCFEWVKVTSGPTRFPSASTPDPRRHTSRDFGRFLLARNAHNHLLNTSGGGRGHRHWWRGQSRRGERGNPRAVPSRARRVLRPRDMEALYRAGKYRGDAGSSVADGGQSVAQGCKENELSDTAALGAYVASAHRVVATTAGAAAGAAASGAQDFQEHWQ